MENQIALVSDRSDAPIGQMPAVDFGNLQRGRSPESVMDTSCPYVPTATFSADCFDFAPTEDPKYVAKEPDMQTVSGTLSHADALDLALSVAGIPEAIEEPNRFLTAVERVHQAVDQDFDAREQGIAQQQWDRLSEPEKDAIQRELLAIARETNKSMLDGGDSNDDTTNDFKIKYPHLSAFMSDLRLSTAHLVPQREEAHSQAAGSLTGDQIRHHSEELRRRRHALEG